MNFYSSAFQPSKTSPWYKALALATGWSKHETAEGKTFYFNPITGVSTFVKPTDDQEKPFAIKAIGNSPWRIVYTDKQHYYFYNKETRWCGWFPPQDVLEQFIWPMDDDERMDLLDPSTALVSEAEEESIKDEKEEEEALEHDEDKDEEEETPDTKKIRLDDIEQVIATKELTTQEKTQKFIELLKENNVSPYDSWALVVPKIKDDERFQLLTSEKEKTKAFAAYGKDMIQAIQEEQRMKKEALCKEFELYVMENVSEKSYFDDFKRNIKRLSKFKSLDSYFVEKTFKDRVKFLKKSKSETSTNVTVQKKDEFWQLLLDTLEIHMKSRWRDVKPLIQNDERFNSVSSMSEKEDIFYDYLEFLKSESEQDRKSRLERQAMNKSSIESVANKLKK
ncbi:WW domain-containing protein [Rozella allomycis CSF55]|uniref:WW domain-containing protein n=1 Tax=Rozella allomycis (strain CSF55) TaxID=988480 RepID=A0A075AU01_ROZAC|nr:WW domain-containing protein [Rozella allomycis CSF55]|eukprot:EPZ32017.1 WW domain-containing protein [Rozella allomycis CSF55]